MKIKRKLLIAMVSMIAFSTVIMGGVTLIKSISTISNITQSSMMEVNRRNFITSTKR